MITEFKSSFARDLQSLTSKSLRRRIEETIEAVEKAPTLERIPKLKKLRGAADLYRIRVGQYRLGVMIRGEKVTFVRCRHRKEIYRYFG